MPVTRASSSATMSHKPIDAQMDSRSLRTTRHRSKGDEGRAAAQSQRESEWDICGLCKTDKSLQKHKVKDLMIRCDIDECSGWYHSWCVMKSETGNSLMFSPQTGFQRAIFICPECVASPERGHVKGALEAMRVFLTTMGKLEAGETGPAPPIQLHKTIEIPDSSPGDDISSPPGKEHDRAMLLPTPSYWVEEHHAGFEPAREEKFQGFNKSEVDHLFRNLQQSIFEYDLEIRDIMTRFGGPNDLNNAAPLAFWSYVDPNLKLPEGDEWHVPGSLRSKAKSHAPITSALRRMLGTAIDAPLTIDSSLLDISFSRIHTAFIWWFVFDILLNRVDIFDLPNMKPMRIMMSAIHNFGEASKSNKMHKLPAGS